MCSNSADARRAADANLPPAASRSRDHPPPSQPRRGFSLAELIVVMVIIGLLASVVAFRTRSYLILSKQNAARLEVAKIGQALETFYGAYDRYPTNEEGLEILAARTEHFPDGILNKVPLDPWKNPYQYICPGRDAPYEVICLGADRREGGDGPDRDISSSDQEGTSHGRPL